LDALGHRRRAGRVLRQPGQCRFGFGEFLLRVRQRLGEFGHRLDGFVTLPRDGRHLGRQAFDLLVDLGLVVSAIRGAENGLLRRVGGWFGVWHCATIMTPPARPHTSKRSNLSVPFWTTGRGLIVRRHPGACHPYSQTPIAPRSVTVTATGKRSSSARGRSAMVDWGTIVADVSDRWPLYASIPFIAALIGYVTKRVAIEMMFRPLEFVGIPPLLGWQGVLPGNAERMASIATETLTRNLVDPREIFSRLDPEQIAREVEKPLLEAVD